MGALNRCLIRMLLSTALACIAPVAASAQICEGVPSLRERPFAVGATYSRSDAGWAAGGAATWGRSAFVSLASGYVRYEDMAFSASRADASSAVFHLGAGYEVQAQLAGGRGGRGGRGTTLGICPAGYVEYETGPDGDFGVTLNSNGLTAALGASIGAVVLERGTIRLIPYVGMACARVSTTVHDFPLAGTDTKDTEYGGLLDLGIGIVLGRVTIGPEATFPIGFEGADASYGVGVSLSFGRGRR